jgi:hypothetical protein
MGRRGALLVAAPIAAAGLLLSSGPGVAWGATSWLVPVGASSSAEGRSEPIPSAPTGATAACAAPTSSKTIKVSWTAVTHATTYTIYDATTSATGTYSVAASGVSGTSWTSGNLSNNTNYWFEVTASVGSNWTSVTSSATAESTIRNQSPFCQQP